jgi:spore germination cell wall hydrolase CwlJ-like protein
VLNRVKSGLYPSSVCGVVYQNRNRYMGCQFSFACEGKSLRVTEPDAWARASRIATSVLKGDTYIANVGSSLNYHADYVRPHWARALQRAGVVGRHIFYKPKDPDG